MLTPETEPSRLTPPPAAPANSIAAAGEGPLQLAIFSAKNAFLLRAVAGVSDRAETVFVAREVGDTLTFMDGGVVVESGDPREIIANPQHARTKEFLSRVL